MERKFGDDHPTLVHLVKQCLHNVPCERPNIEALLTALQGMRVEMEGEYGGPFKLDMVRLRTIREMKLKDRRIAELTQQQVKGNHAIAVSIEQYFYWSVLGGASGRARGKGETITGTDSGQRWTNSPATKPLFKANGSKW